MFTLKRCSVCGVGESFCICSIQPTVKLPFQLTILSNPEEFIKPTNTAKLLKNSYSETDIIEWKRKEPPLNLIESLKDQKIHPYVLYPANNALTFDEIDFSNFKKGSKIRIILLDGTWKQSRKMYNHSDYLQNLPALKLVTETKSQYQLRNQRGLGRLSTIESVIETLKLFKDHHNAKMLSSYFKVFQWAYIHSKMNKAAGYDAAALFDTFASVTGPG